MLCVSQTEEVHYEISLSPDATYFIGCMSRKRFGKLFIKRERKQSNSVPFYAK
jgi:hypothetical protein